MPFWKCNTCGFTFQSGNPPEDNICPSCKQSCTLKNGTCYIPECGFEGTEEHIDHRL